MFHVALYQPEIPPNTGNIIRLCANTGAQLHLIHPLGFQLTDKALRRAGLDYHDLAMVHEHASLERLRAALPQARWLAFSTRGVLRYDRVAYCAGDVLLFGPETRGLPDAVLETLPASQRLYLPMRAASRSLNLANAVAIAVYEAWRQMGFDGSRA
ncbi:tRNA (cytidine/uridine-2'-O-)-methyltransferase [Fontimonas thermophila]|uniref:tRNA (cytidine(34)-2'-O)-methyltransferase n=1 Tax=Fontimonas thermophila TaxID=1076937 RepID=A0A1I2JES9_9GAMM|nr:tRNA (cytidine(34)-2'-O)-methyltransferase [Fontimonas thermophila]SFF51366.1 tRNA (cytidine/uridine-2'-O-)-methyltransferase [Fontimonas thermophila]